MFAEQRDFIPLCASSDISREILLTPFYPRRSRLSSWRQVEVSLFAKLHDSGTSSWPYNAQIDKCFVRAFGSTFFEKDFNHVLQECAFRGRNIVKPSNDFRRFYVKCVVSFLFVTYIFRNALPDLRNIIRLSNVIIAICTS